MPAMYLVSPLRAFQYAWEKIKGDSKCSQMHFQYMRILVTWSQSHPFFTVQQ